jgi:hypothetical protein
MEERHEHEVTEEVSEDYAAEKYSRERRVANVIWTLLLALEALLGLRFVLRLLAANPANAFADFIYDLSRVFLAPFFGLFEEPAFDGSVFEYTTLVAMIVYALIAWIIVRLIEVVMVPSEVRRARTLRRQH